MKIAVRGIKKISQCLFKAVFFVILWLWKVEEDSDIDVFNVIKKGRFLYKSFVTLYLSFLRMDAQKEKLNKICLSFI